MRCLCRLRCLTIIGAVLRAGVVLDQPSRAVAVGDEEVTLGFTVQNKYTERYGPSGAKYPWISDTAVIAEPYMPSRLVVLGTPTETTEQLQYLWTVGDDTYSGDNAAVFFTELESLSLTLTEVAVQTGSVRRQTTGTVHVKRVKRELRTLDQEDLDRFMDALEVVYRTKEADGRKLYGKGYRDIGWYLRAHNIMAGNRNCDHFHNGMGFLTQHIVMGLHMDNVVHMVDPGAPSTPYWDHTIEATELDKSRMNWDEAFYKSDLFVNGIFGEFPDVDDNDFAAHQVTKGRWANISMSAQHWGADYCPVTNAFGMLRSPWNLNGANFLSRSRKNFGYYATALPQCRDHYKQLQFQDFADFGLQIQFAAHGLMHVVTGGQYGSSYHDVLAPYMSVRTINKVAQQSFGKFKQLWRDGLLECPLHCNGKDVSGPTQAVPKGHETTPSVAAVHAAAMGYGNANPSGECTCYCPELQKYMDKGESFSILSRMGLTTEWELRNDPALPDAVLNMMCNSQGQRPHIGDSLTSAAPADPTFWSLHTTSDRLWQWRRLNGLVFNWPENNYIFEPGVCWGHGANDTLTWKNVFDSDEHYYTNFELVKLMDPARNDVTNYVYDNFLWQHCADDYGLPPQLIENAI